MNELYSLIMKHCDRLLIQAKTIDNSSIDFDSYSELMEYSNFQGSRIKTLEISGYNGNNFKEIIDITFSAEHTLSFTAEYKCKFTNEKDEVIFLHDIHIFLQKAMCSNIPVIIMSALTLLFLVFSLLAIVHAVGPDVYTNVYILIALSSVLGVIYWFIFPFYIWKKLFPPVSFAWGEAANYYNRIFKIRSNIFWGIIVALIISVFANIISSGLVNI